MRLEARMPDSDTPIAQHRVVRWHVDVGDAIQPGTTMCELVATAKNRFVADPSSRSRLAFFRSRVETHQVREDLAPTVIVIAAEVGVVSQLVALPDALVDTDDLLSHVEVGSEPGEGGRFRTIAEVVPSETETDA